MARQVFCVIIRDEASCFPIWLQFVRRSCTLHSAANLVPLIVHRACRILANYDNAVLRSTLWAWASHLRVLCQGCCRQKNKKKSENSCPWRYLLCLVARPMIPVVLCVCENFVRVNFWGTRWRSWLRHCATSRKVAGSIPDGVIVIFLWHNPSDRSMAEGLTQSLTEMNTRNISCAGA